MDDKLKKALDFANYRQTLNNQLHKLRIKSEGMLIIAEAGGKFTITQELLCFLDYLNRIGSVETILLDDNKSPIKINNVSAFLKKTTDRYFEVTQDYFKEAQIIKKSRTVQSILAIKNT
jgi:hypothetical protein